MPSPVFAISRPRAAASLNDLSPRPPTSNTRPAVNGAPAPGVAFAVLPAGLEPHPASRAATSATPAARAYGGIGMVASRCGGCLRRVDPGAELPAAPAARLVDVGAADHHASRAADLAVGAIGRLATNDTDRQRLGDVLGDREQIGHRLEGLALVVLVEPGHDHALAPARELVDHRQQVAAEELALVDPDHLRLVGVTQDLARGAHRPRRDPELAVRYDRVGRVAAVDVGLEDLDPLAGDLGAAQTPDQLLGL